MVTPNSYVDVCKGLANYKCYRVDCPHETSLPSDTNCKSGKVLQITLMFN